MGLIYGWVARPDGRGTMDILWGCLSSVLLCTWTVLCLNLPAKNERKGQLVLRKARWMIVAIFGPEFLLAFAVSQWESARRSVAEFKSSGFSGWTLRHSFFADMGGFVLSTACEDQGFHDEEDEALRSSRNLAAKSESRSQPVKFPQFPITAKQLHYLVDEKYLAFPNISAEEIADRSKADGFTKILTMAQVGWFLLQCISRLAQKLDLTTLEISTAATIVCTFTTFCVWLRKPKDVDTPIILHANVSIEDILLRAGEVAMKPYRDNPLDFVDNGAVSWSATTFTPLGIHFGPRERPAPRFTNDKFMQNSTALGILFCSSSMVYGGIHLAAWNYEFPTGTERLVWRVCCLILVSVTAVFAIAERLESIYHSRFGKGVVSKMSCRGRVSKPAEGRLKGEPKWALILPILMLITVVYAGARIYLVAEVLVGLRAIPASSFEEVDWTRFLPHL